MITLLQAMSFERAEFIAYVEQFTINAPWLSRPFFADVLNEHWTESTSVAFLNGGCKEFVWESPSTGVIRQCDAYLIGMASFILGAGRNKASDAVHPGVGIYLEAKVGEYVQS